MCLRAAEEGKASLSARCRRLAKHAPTSRTRYTPPCSPDRDRPRRTPAAAGYPRRRRPRPFSPSPAPARPCAVSSACAAFSQCRQCSRGPAVWRWERAGSPLDEDVCRLAGQPSTWNTLGPPHFPLHSFLPSLRLPDGCCCVCTPFAEHAPCELAPYASPVGHRSSRRCRVVDLVMAASARRVGAAALGAWRPALRGAAGEIATAADWRP